MLLLDPFRVVARHKRDFEACHLPDVKTATYNPLTFIREEEGLAVRDINVLLDGLLTPPRPGAHDNSRHFYESARAIIAGYMAWVRFHETAHRRTLKRVYGLLNAVRRHQRNQRLAQTARRLRPEISHAPLPSHEGATHRRPILWSQETINDPAAETRPRRPPTSSSRGQERGTWVVTFVRNSVISDSGHRVQ